VLKRFYNDTNLVNITRENEGKTEETKEIEIGRETGIGKI
jgi:hypothetical protein